MPKGKITGLFFGSFNPVHTGHLIIASHMLEWAGLSEVWFIVSPHNPLKKKNTLLDDHHRLALLNVAIEDDPRFRASNIEFGLPRPSYTINTLAVLTEKYPRRQFALIMGADNLQTIHKWKNYEQLLRDYKIYLYPRPNADGGAYRDHPNVTHVDAPLIEISSTFIRQAISSGKCVKYLVPEKTEKYIQEMHFYKKG
jgi:nicotinate-nucleotide adenylyltransferase